ncbi:hypothetical protein MBLNU459_g5034t1 [Dothideomycetes sp. NU459]
MKALGVLLTLTVMSASDAPLAGALILNKTLVPFTYDLLNIGEIEPRGWISDQLQLEANGLAGNLYNFYRYVKESTWLGGTYEYSELHESAPYWYNGLVPLAYLLKNDALQSQVDQFLDYVLGHQADDGWLGPETTRESRGIWARCLLLQGMMNHAIANPAQKQRIIPAMVRFVQLAHTMLQNNYTGYIQQPGDNFDPYGFGLARAHELSTSLQWLYEQDVGDAAASVIWDTMDLMWAGAVNAKKDWTKFFVVGTFPTGSSQHPAGSNLEHGVNLAEGTIIADEYLGGLSPQRGSELCMAVETMFSLAYLYRLFGDNSFADQAELAAFNALPAPIANDWWSHQYVTQTNQPWSRNLTAKPFYNVVSYGNVYGLEPNFPCCTVNHPQAYPKFVISSFVRKGMTGLVHQFLVPAIVTTAIDGGSTRVQCVTLYPFGTTLTYTITTERPFDFFTRIPAWATSQSLMRQNNATYTLSIGNTSLHHVSVAAGSTTFSIELNMTPRVVWRANSTAAIYLGALLYALDINALTTTTPSLNWTDQKPLASNQTYAHVHDHVITPVTNDSWAIAIDPSKIIVQEAPGDTLSSPVIAFDAPPVILSVAATRIQWNLSEGTADLPPIDPQPVGEPFWAKFVPYGSAKLHMAQLPTLNLTL